MAASAPWALLAWAVLVACGPASPGPARLGDLTVHGPVLVVPPGGNAALYLSVHNRGSEADRLIGLESPLGEGGWHRTVREGGRVRMVAAPEGFEVPAGGHLRLSPGGDHGMLTGVRALPTPGQRVPVALRFARAGELRLEAEVVGQAAGGDGAGYGDHP